MTNGWILNVNAGKIRAHLCRNGVILHTNAIACCLVGEQDVIPKDKVSAVQHMNFSGYILRRVLAKMRLVDLLQIVVSARVRAAAGGGDDHALNQGAAFGHPYAAL